MFDFLILMCLGMALIIVYAHIIVKMEKQRKIDLDPKSEYPHIALFKYFCVFVVSLVAFLSFGFLIGGILCLISMVMAPAILILATRGVH